MAVATVSGGAGKASLGTAGGSTSEGSACVGDTVAVVDETAAMLLLLTLLPVGVLSSKLFVSEACGENNEKQGHSQT